MVVSLTSMAGAHAAPAWSLVKQGLPSGTEVLDRYVEATGGRDELPRHKSRPEGPNYPSPGQNGLGLRTVFQLAASPERAK